MRLKCPSFVNKITGKLGLEKVSPENSQKIEISNLPFHKKKKTRHKKLWPPKNLSTRTQQRTPPLLNAIKLPQMSSCKFSCHVHLGSRKKAASRAKRAKILDSSGKSFKTRLFRFFGDMAWPRKREGNRKNSSKHSLGFLGSEHEVQRPISCWISLGIGVSCKYQIHSDTASLATWNHNFEFLKFPIWTILAKL